MVTNNSKNTVTIMVDTGEMKFYYVAFLSDVLEVVTGRRAFSIKRRVD